MFTFRASRWRFHHVYDFKNAAAAAPRAESAEPSSRARGGSQERSGCCAGVRGFEAQTSGGNFGSRGGNLRTPNPKLGHAAKIPLEPSGAKVVQSEAFRPGFEGFLEGFSKSDFMTSGTPPLPCPAPSLRSRVHARGVGLKSARAAVLGSEVSKQKPRDAILDPGEVKLRTPDPKLFCQNRQKKRFRKAFF